MGGKFDPEHFAIEGNVASIFTFPCATDGHDGNRRRETYPTRPIALVVPIAARRLARADEAIE